VVRPPGVIGPEPKTQPADLTEILRASVAALKSDRAKADGDAKTAKAAETAKTAETAQADTDEKTDEKAKAKPRPRRKASA
jgi:hypothetical protein